MGNRVALRSRPTHRFFHCSDAEPRSKNRLDAGASEEPRTDRLLGQGRAATATTPLGVFAGCQRAPHLGSFLGQPKRSAEVPRPLVFGQWESLIVLPEEDGQQSTGIKAAGNVMHPAISHLHAVH